MNVGECLDDAAAALTTAAARIRAETQPHPYDIYGALTARDLVYQGLGRLTVLIRNLAPGQHPIWEDIPLLRATDRNEPGPDQGRLLAACIQLARLNRNHVDFAQLPKHGTIPALIAPAASAIGLAAEIIATHLDPSKPPPDTGNSSADLATPGSVHTDEATLLATYTQANRRFRTIEGAAIATGAHRALGAGEIARLGTLAIELDRAMMHWAGTWYHGESLRIHRLLTSDVPQALTEIGRSPPATLLRELEPAPVTARPSGPVRIQSLHDIHTTISAARLTIHNRPSQATIALATQTALLGFAITATISRLNGEGTSPSPTTEQHGHAWRNIAIAASKLADIRDSQSHPFPTELGTAALWLRQQIPHLSTIAPASHGDWAKTLQQIQANLSKLCTELLEPIRTALYRRLLMTPEPVFLGRIKAGIHVTGTTWRTARPDNRAAAELADSLNAASQLPVRPVEPMPASDIHPAASAQLSKAFPQPIGPPTQPPPGRQQPTHRRDSAGSRQTTTSHER